MQCVRLRRLIGYNISRIFFQTSNATNTVTISLVAHAPFSVCVFFLLFPGLTIVSWIWGKDLWQGNAWTHFSRLLRPLFILNYVRVFLFHLSLHLPRLPHSSLFTPFYFPLSNWFFLRKKKLLWAQLEMQLCIIPAPSDLWRWYINLT